jgi:hypothetical protein
MWAVGSACRSVSIEFGTLPTGPTAAPTVNTVVPVQQVPINSDLTKSSTLTETGDAAEHTVAVPAPGAMADAAASSFAPRGATEHGSGMIAKEAQRDTYAFDGTQAQLLEVRAKRTSGVSLEPQIELLDPSGLSEELAKSSNGAQMLLEGSLASTGRYTIVVSASRGVGPYWVDWALDRFGQLVSGSEVRAELTDPGQKDRYRFEARQGQQLNAQVSVLRGFPCDHRSI